MPWSALPERLRSVSAWAGTDWDNPWQRWLIPLKGWFAFGPRATEWWAKWREIPKTLIAVRGPGMFRYENSDGTFELAGVASADAQYSITHEEYILKGPLYLSRVQYWCRWHFAVQWPFQISFHWYWRQKDVPPPFKRPGSLGISKIFFAYGPTHRDADQVYWMPSFFVGGDWK